MADARAEDDVGLEVRFAQIASEFAAPLARLARGYEGDADRQKDLVQDIFVALWRALPSFEGRASLRTWVYRVAHNVAATHCVRGARDQLGRCASLEDFEAGRLMTEDARAVAEARDDVRRLAALVRSLRPAERQIILLHLEGFDTEGIGEVTGLSHENVRVRVHRIKAALRVALAKEKP